MGAQASVILSGLAGAVLLEVGRRERSAALYMGGAALVAWAAVGVARALRDEGAGGNLVDEVAPGHVLTV